MVTVVEVLDSKEAVSMSVSVETELRTPNLRVTTVEASEGINNLEVDEPEL